jgi:hypothetical protein
MARRRGGRFEAELHADAQRLLAEADYPASGKQMILMALRGGRRGKQRCLVCGKAAQRCQFFVPPELTQLVPAPTTKPSVYWLCEAHYGQRSEAEIVALERARTLQGADRARRTRRP